MGGPALAAPTLTATVPAGPSNDETPLVQGTGPAGSAIRVYDTGGCTGIPLATGSAATLAAPGIEVPVTENARTQLRATAILNGIESACAVGPVYTEDSAPPAAPSISSFDPESPANDETPRVRGAAAAGSTVALFLNNSCAGSPMVTGTAAAFASPGLTITVPENAFSQVTAAATDVAGNTSIRRRGRVRQPGHRGLSQRRRNDDADRHRHRPGG